MFSSCLFHKTLELFLRNLLLDENHILLNRTMHISGMFHQDTKVDIVSEKVDIDTKKVDIDNKLPSNSFDKTRNHISMLYAKAGEGMFFGRSLVEEVTGLKPSAASKLIKLMLDSKIIEPVKGHGKGKYRFM